MPAIDVTCQPLDDDLAAAWDGLAETVASDPFRRRGWIAAWTAAFGHGRLRLLVARRRGAVVGLLPLLQRFGRWSSPTNWHTPSFGPLSSDAAVTEALVRAASHPHVAILSLSFLEPGPASVDPLLRVARSQQRRTLVRIKQRSPFLATTGTWEDYLDGLRSKRRAELRRRRRRLHECGTISVDVIDGMRPHARALDEGFALEAAGWKGAAGTAIASDRRTRAFYTEVARWAAAEGALRLVFLRLDGQAIAFDYALEQGGRHYLLKQGHDPAWRRYAPSDLLRAAMLERAFTSDLQSYEFLGADEPWKRAWTSTHRERFQVESFAPSAAGAMAWAAAVHARPLAQRGLETLRRRVSR